MGGRACNHASYLGATNKAMAPGLGGEGEKIPRWKEDGKREDVIFMIALQWPKGSIFVGEWTKKTLSDFFGRNQNCR